MCQDKSPPAPPPGRVGEQRVLVPGLHLEVLREAAVEAGAALHHQRLARLVGDGAVAGGVWWAWGRGGRKGADGGDE